MGFAPILLSKSATGSKIIGGTHMSEFLEAIREASDMPLDGVTDGVILAMR